MSKVGCTLPNPKSFLYMIHTSLEWSFPQQQVMNLYQEHHKGRSTYSQLSDPNAKNAELTGLLGKG